MISEGSAELRPHDVGFGLLFATVRDAVVVAEAGTGRIVLWNPAAEAVFGYTAAEARDMGVDALVPDSLRARHRAGLGRFAATGHGAIIDAHAALELPALRKGGASIRVELTLSPLDDPGRGGRLVLAIVRDVTERAALRATEREYTRRLEELAVLKADFTAMVAHELGAPIAAVRALADMLATGEAGAGERAWALDTLRAQAATLAALVADVRAIAAAERDDFAVRPRPVPVAALLADATAFARMLPGDHPIETPSPIRAQAMADPERIGQVLRNLLGNAARYSPPGGPIELRAAEEGGRVRVAVADRGYGIHPDDLARIFAKFGRGRDQSGGHVPGAGLGLYLSRRIVRAHGGELTAGARPGGGSIFAFDLAAAR